MRESGAIRATTEAISYLLNGEIAHLHSLAPTARAGVKLNVKRSGASVVGLDFGAVTPKLAPPRNDITRVKYLYEFLSH